MSKVKHPVIENGHHKSFDVLEVFIDKAPVAIAMFDNDMRYIAASTRWKQDYSLTDQELVGCHHYQIFPEIPDSWREIHQRGLCGESVSKKEDCFIRSDGSEQWLHWEVHPWMNDQDTVGGIIIMTEDITERKRHEENLYATEQVNRVTFELAAVGIAHVGLDGQWLRVNDELCRMVGYTSDELTQSTIQEISDPDDLPVDFANLQELLADKRHSYSMEKRYFRKDRSAIWVNLTVSLVRDNQGNPIHFISIIQNISDSKLAKDKLREQLAELQTWQEVTLYREERIIELKNEVNDLLAKLNEPKRYNDHTQ